LSKHVGDFRG